MCARLWRRRVIQRVRGPALSDSVANDRAGVGDAQPRPATLRALEPSDAQPLSLNSIPAQVRLLLRRLHSLVRSPEPYEVGKLVGAKIGDHPERHPILAPALEVVAAAATLGGAMVQKTP